MQRSKALLVIAEAIGELSNGHPQRVAVNGRIASGKTTFALELADELRRQGRSVKQVGVDGFHNPRSVRYRQGRNSARGYYEDAYDLDVMRQSLLEPLGSPTPNLDGKWIIRTAIHDLDSDTPIEGQIETLNVGDVLIVDGSFLLAKRLRRYWDYSIFIDVKREVGAERGASRDADHLNGIAEARRLHDERYQAACDIYLEENEPRKFADVVFNNTSFDEPEIEFASRQHKYL